MPTGLIPPGSPAGGPQTVSGAPQLLYRQSPGGGGGGGGAPMGPPPTAPRVGPAMGGGGGGPKPVREAQAGHSSGSRGPAPNIGYGPTRDSLPTAASPQASAARARRGRPPTAMPPTMMGPGAQLGAAFPGSPPPEAIGMLAQMFAGGVPPQQPGMGMGGQPMAPPQMGMGGPMGMPMAPGGMGMGMPPAPTPPTPQPMAQQPGAGMQPDLMQLLQMMGRGR